MARALTKTKIAFKTCSVSLDNDILGAQKLADWLLDYATQESRAHLSLCWLLAHADDGVIWGKIFERQTEGGPKKHLRLSHNAFDKISPELSLLTLQQLRLFSSEGELYLWRTGEETFQGRLIDDTNQCQDEDCSREAAKNFDESQILWGDRLPESKKEAHKNGFTLVEEGQGLRHAVPLPLEEIEPHLDKPPQYRPLRLKLRHYLTYDDTDQARIYLSRLVGLGVEAKKRKTGGRHGSKTT